MLVSDIRAIHNDPILNVISGGKKSVELRTGVYLIHHFGCSNFLCGYEDYPEFEGNDEGYEGYRGPYGVCDSLEQLLEKYPELEADGRKFLVTLHEVKRSEQSPTGGWRWHKWGEYIGTQEPQCEYLYDEPKIESVFVYHIYERKD